MDRFVVISGCSGGGKSTLLAELAQRGYATVDEPGRRVVEQELQSGGDALPWLDPAAFARRALELAIADRAACRAQGWVFFDRSVVDAAAAIEHVTGEIALEALGRAYRYNECVFLAPPWPEIYATDGARRHGVAEAIAEYQRLATAYPGLGYEVMTLPKTCVAERADFVLATLAGPTPPRRHTKS
jgi:predicted ATPase